MHNLRLIMLQLALAFLCSCVTVQSGCEGTSQSIEACPQVGMPAHKDLKKP